MGHGLFYMPSVHWGLQIAIYLFLGGLAGGSYITGYVADLLSTRTELPEEYLARRETARWGMYVAVAAIGVGGIALVSHLGKPLRAFYFPLTFDNYGSWMVIGTWTIVIFTLFAVVQAFWYTFGSAVEGEAGMSLFGRRLLSRWIRLDPGGPGRSRIVRLLDWIADLTRPPRWLWLGFGVIGAGLAAILIAYTALLLSAVTTVPLWNRTLLPLLFLMSGISTGIAAATGLTMLFEGLSETVHQYSLADDALIVLELIILGTLLSTLEPSGLSGRVTLYLANHPYQVVFWVGFVLIGLVTPVAASLVMTALCYPEGHEALSVRMQRFIHVGFLGKYALVLGGGFLIRLLVLLLAVQKPYIPIEVPGM
ncbi:MAG: DmsC/YnfH family molybdoenzyme membrane anchor subunit [Halodesulfurarchaeum sp.]